jgi:hypothetical protein
LSRENAQKTLEQDARHPVIDVTAMIMTSADIAAAADVSPTACLKIAMKGNAGFSARAASRSPALKRITTNMANPIDPLIKMPVMIDRGTTRVGFWISSLICEMSISNREDERVYIRE